ncbi:hypothetical protein [secondary endosymbiont of Ctenarytaina eucalypti]|uniref:hypothetical protein n=1 Tax=secondary endosymbiont of Ctenarytaina eucalypti TaxID=1199245 RepID=UPI0018A82AD9|nr:hypothetical protein [secondary endosymbiont of Ctenarytaina eucalypti]
MILVYLRGFEKFFLFPQEATGLSYLANASMLQIVACWRRIAGIHSMPKKNKMTADQASRE